jgi:hypothetical protein
MDLLTLEMPFKNGLGENMEMKFDKKQFKRHHLRILIYYFIAGAVLMMISALIVYHAPDRVLWIIIFGVILIGGVMIFATGVVQFILLKTDSLGQKQSFEKNGTLMITTITDEWYPWGVTLLPHCLVEWNYEIKKILKITTTYTHIIIKGNMSLMRIDNKAISSKKRVIVKTVNIIRIPRNFTNEDQIINLDIKKYNEIVHGLSAETEKQKQANNKKGAASRLNLR